MRESLLWKNLKPELSRIGKFQKISDRFTPGVPDVIGCYQSKGIALELKELKGSRIIKTKFRPKQLMWLSEWISQGGIGFIVASYKKTVFIFPVICGNKLESGLSEPELHNLSFLTFTKTPKNTWKDYVKKLSKIFHNTHLQD